MSRVVLVTGGRYYDDLERVMEILSSLVPAPTAIVNGGATGADALADRVAIKLGIPSIKYPANWNGHGRRAGPIRNQRMIDEMQPDLVVAFPGGAGTADCVRRARAANVEVMEIEPRTKACGEGGICELH